MELCTPDAALAEKAAPLVPDFIHATGPSSYDYQFGPGRDLFDPFIERAWRMPRTLFSHTEATLALDGEAVAGVEIGYGGRDWYGLKPPLRQVTIELLQAGTVAPERMKQMAQRTHLASYLNPYVPENAYYVLALSVAESHRGGGLGAKLLTNAIDEARKAGYRELHLDVLSDNAAVGFYRRMGLVPVAETVAPEPCREHSVPMEIRMVYDLGRAG